MEDSPIQQLAPENIDVKSIATTELIPNPHNPRMLFDRMPMDVLRESILKVGILVPLTVYWSKERKRYVILDGQRRWMCAQELKLSQVPVNQVAEPTLVQNIVTMFQIHKFREDWELMPTALKLEVLMKALNEKSEKKLAELCGLDQAVVVRCKKLLSYPRKYQDLMLDPDPEKRVKADFFIELYVIINDRFVNKFTWFSKDRFTRRMLNKYQNRLGGIKAVTDFRIMKQHISNARRAGEEPQIGKRLFQYMQDDTLTLDHLILKSASISADTRKLVLNISKITAAIAEINPDDYYGEETLWAGMETLLKIIRRKLIAAGRRLKE
jgi:ParB family transcriptional regulator, chromosome partitioning protein